MRREARGKGGSRAVFKFTNTFSGFLVLEESGLALQAGGTMLARVAPRLADGCATEGLGADDSVELVDAQGTLNAGVARTSSVI